MPAVEPPIDSLLPEEMAPPEAGGPFEDIPIDPEQFEQMLADAAIRGRAQGGRQVAERRASQGSVGETVNAVSEAIQRRLAEITQGVLR